MLQPFETICESSLSPSGTSFFAELAGLSFVDMMDLFDAPHFEGVCDKVDVEWNMQFTDSQGEDHVFTLYNWKNGPAFDSGWQDLDHIREWHVGFNVYSSPQVQHEFFYALVRYIAKFTKVEVRLSPWRGPERPVTILPAEL